MLTIDIVRSNYYQITSFIEITKYQKKVFKAFFYIQRVIDHKLNIYLTYSYYFKSLTDNNVCGDKLNVYLYAITKRHTVKTRQTVNDVFVDFVVVFRQLKRILFL